MIESMQNKLVKKIASLKQKKYREQEDLFVVEGLRFVQEIPSDWVILWYGISEDFIIPEHNWKTHANVPVYTFSQHVFQSMSSTEHPQGILALCQQKHLQQKHFIPEENGFYLLLEELTDPGNLGTIIRVADACGIHGIFLSSGCVDLYNPKVLRSTMGSLFHIPIYQNCNLKETIDVLHQHHTSVYAAHLEGITYPYTLDLKKSCGILIGNEARGLSNEASALCDTLVKIPMPGQAESLNAAIAAGILLYEVVRQRL